MHCCLRLVATFEPKLSQLLGGEEWVMGEELRDYQWVLIEPLLPAPKRRGRRADTDTPLMVSSVCLDSGAYWKDLPPQYGPRSTCRRRLKEWQEQRVAGWSGLPPGPARPAAPTRWGGLDVGSSLMAGKEKATLRSLVPHSVIL